MFDLLLSLVLVVFCYNSIGKELELCTKIKFRINHNWHRSPLPILIFVRNVQNIFQLFACIYILNGSELRFYAIIVAEVNFLIDSCVYKAVDDPRHEHEIVSVLFLQLLLLNICTFEQL